MKDLLTCQHLIPLLRSDFGSLWKCQARGNTIEIITPFSTTTQKFVSVFITAREEELVVSDGGWFHDDYNFYGTLGEPDEIELENIEKHYSEAFQIKTFTDSEKRTFYFKRVAREE